MVQLAWRALFSGFDLLPVAQHGIGRAFDIGVNFGAVAGRARSLVAKNMRMTAHQLAIQRVEHIGDGEVALVGGHLRIEKHLKQQVAEFFGQMREVAALDGVEDLVGLFQRVFADGIEGLFAVPGAAAGSAKAGHDGHGLLKQRCRPRRVGDGLRRGISLRWSRLAEDPCISSLPCRAWQQGDARLRRALAGTAC